MESEKEAVPILVCLTHADRLYAEIMAQENTSKDKHELCKRYIRSELNVSDGCLERMSPSLRKFCVAGDQREIRALSFS